ncbi:MAG: hypothetical protein WC552_09745, partial [Candidatus Omnitrophota bacterium]
MEETPEKGRRPRIKVDVLLEEFKGCSKKKLRDGFWDDVLFKKGKPYAPAIKAFLKLMAKGLDIPAYRINTESYHLSFRTNAMQAQRSMYEMLKRYMKAQGLTYKQADKELRRIAGICHPSVVSLIQEFEECTKARFRDDFWNDVLFKEGKPYAQAIKAFLELMAEGLGIPAYRINCGSFHARFKIKNMQARRSMDRMLQIFADHQRLSIKKAAREIKKLSGIEHPSAFALLKEFKEWEGNKFPVGFWDDVLFKEGEPYIETIKAFLELMAKGLGIFVYEININSFKKTFKTEDMKASRKMWWMLVKFAEISKLSLTMAGEKLKLLAEIPSRQPAYSWRAKEDLYDNTQRLESVLKKSGVVLASDDMRDIEKGFSDPGGYRAFVTGLMEEYRRGNIAVLTYLLRISQPLMEYCFNARNKKYNFGCLDRLHLRGDILQTMRLFIIQYLGYFNEKGEMSFTAYMHRLLMRGFNEAVSVKGGAAVKLEKRKVSLHTPVGKRGEGELANILSSEGSFVAGRSDSPATEGGEASSPLPSDGPEAKNKERKGASVICAQSKGKDKERISKAMREARAFLKKRLGRDIPARAPPCWIVETEEAFYGDFFDVEANRLYIKRSLLNNPTINLPAVLVSALNAQSDEENKKAEKAYLKYQRAKAKVLAERQAKDEKYKALAKPAYYFLSVAKLNVLLIHLGRLRKTGYQAAPRPDGVKLSRENIKAVLEIPPEEFLETTKWTMGEAQENLACILETLANEITSKTKLWSRVKARTLGAALFIRAHNEPAANAAIVSCLKYFLEDLTRARAKAMPKRAVFIKYNKREGCYEIIEGKILDIKARGDEAVSVHIYDKKKYALLWEAFTAVDHQ